jgi:hypothetical protein
MVKAQAAMGVIQKTARRKETRGAGSARPNKRRAIRGEGARGVKARNSFS